MKTIIDDGKKIYSMWFTNNEDPNISLPINVLKEMEEYSNKKYKICMYQSGTQELKKNSLELLLSNCSV